MSTLRSLADGDPTTGVWWSGLLALLVCAIVVVPFLGSSLATELLSLGLFQAAVVGAISLAWGPGRHLVFILCTSIAWFALIIVSVAVDILHGPALLFSAVLLIASLWATFANLVKERAGNVDNLMGAIFGYILLGATWAILYAQMERWQPGSFAFEEGADLSSKMIYFSMVTLTTLGYGDVLPKTRPAEVMAGLQAIVGVLYIAVMVGSIVGTYQRSDER